MREGAFTPAGGDLRADEVRTFALPHWAPAQLARDAERTQVRASPAQHKRTSDVLRWGREWGCAPRLGERVTRQAVQYFDDERRLHRTDGPAAIEHDELHWYVAGRRHRDDGPAIITASGEREWFIDGQRHRTDGPAWIHVDGGMSWWHRGEVHRDGGPALISGSLDDGPGVREAWYRHGALHRTDGPAVTLHTGARQWWLDGHRVSPWDLPHLAAAAPSGSLQDTLFG